MRTKKLLLLGVLGFSLCGFTYSSENNSPLPFSINYKTPLVVKTQESYDKYDYTEYTAGDDIIQLKTYAHYNREKAKKLIEARKFFMELSFKDQISPYPGLLSSTIGCPDDQKPKPSEDTIALRLDYKLLATSNLVYGNCNLTDNYYNCLYCVFFCADKSEAYELKIFSPIGKSSFDYESLKASIKCN